MCCMICSLRTLLAVSRTWKSEHGRGVLVPLMRCGIISAWCRSQKDTRESTAYLPVVKIWVIDDATSFVMVQSSEISH